MAMFYPQPENYIHKNQIFLHEKLIFFVQIVPKRVAKTEGSDRLFFASLYHYDSRFKSIKKIDPGVDDVKLLKQTTMGKSFLGTSNGE